MRLNKLLRALLPIGLMRFNITEEEQALLDEMASGDGEQVGGGASDRLKKLNAIGNRADVEREDQFDDVNDDGSTSRFVAGQQFDENGEPIVDEAAAAEAAAAQVESEAAAARAAAEAEAASATPDTKRKLKINGVEKEFTEEELVALAQKGAAADDKFQEAARLRAEAESLAARSTTPARDVPADDSEELLALARALQVGTDEEAVAALRKLKVQSSPPAIKADEIFQAIDAKLAFNEANRIFETEYADLVQDPRLERMVMEKDNELVKAGDKRPYLVRYREIGNDVREWVKSIAGPAPAPAPAPADPLTEKAARKAAAPAAPPTAGGKAAPTQAEEEPEESVQDVIAGMRKARGGPQWARS